MRCYHRAIEAICSNRTGAKKISTQVKRLIAHLVIDKHGKEVKRMQCKQFKTLFGKMLMDYTDLIETGTSVSNKHPIKQIKKTGAKHGRSNSVITVVYRRDDTS